MTNLDLMMVTIKKFLRYYKYLLEDNPDYNTLFKYAKEQGVNATVLLDQLTKIDKDAEYKIDYDNIPDEAADVSDLIVRLFNDQTTQARRQGIYENFEPVTIDEWYYNNKQLLYKYMPSLEKVTSHINWDAIYNILGHRSIATVTFEPNGDYIYLQKSSQMVENLTSQLSADIFEYTIDKYKNKNVEEIRVQDLISEVLRPLPYGDCITPVEFRDSIYSAGAMASANNYGSETSRSPDMADNYDTYAAFLANPDEYRFVFRRNDE